MIWLNINDFPDATFVGHLDDFKCYRHPKFKRKIWDAGEQIEVSEVLVNSRGVIMNDLCVENCEAYQELLNQIPW